MNLVYGHLVEVVEEDGMRMGRVRVGGASKKVSLGLLTDVTCGEKVPICDGVARDSDSG